MGSMIRDIAKVYVVALLAFGGCGAEQQEETDKAAASANVAATSSADQLVVYYFHTNQRCWTCNQFEKLTKEILEDEFARELKEGALELRVINVEEEANRHFVNDYKLVTKSLVLSLRGEGRQIDWKNLDRIWRLVRDSEKFKGYVTEGIREYLDKVG